MFRPALLRRLAIPLGALLLGASPWRTEALESREMRWVEAGSMTTVLPCAFGACSGPFTEEASEDDRTSYVLPKEDWRDYAVSGGQLQVSYSEASRLGGGRIVIAAAKGALYNCSNARLSVRVEFMSRNQVVTASKDEDGEWTGQLCALRSTISIPRHVTEIRLMAWGSQALSVPPRLPVPIMIYIQRPTP